MLDVKKKECQKRHLAVQDTLSVVNGKWKLVILAILMEGKKRFRELFQGSRNFAQDPFKRTSGTGNEQTGKQDSL